MMSLLKVLELAPMADRAQLAAASGTGHAALTLARLVRIDDDARLVVRDAAGHEHSCDWLEQGDSGGGPLAPGDRLLIACDARGQWACAIGRIGRYTAPKPQANLTLEATESLALKCGESSLEMRADGKVLLKGDDVLIRAKGTQRIRAGNVAIN